MVDRSQSSRRRGHAFGPARGVGIDTIDGLQYRTWEETTAGVSFLSFVYPGSRWAVGAFRHQLAKYRMERHTQGPFFDCVSPPELLAIHAGIRGLPDRSDPFCEPHTPRPRRLTVRFRATRTTDCSLATASIAKRRRTSSSSSTFTATASPARSDVTDRLAIGAAVQYFRFRDFRAQPRVRRP